MTSVYVVARDTEHGSDFVNRNSLSGCDFKLLFDQTSFFSLLNDLIRNCPDGVAAVVHDDIYLPHRFEENLQKTISDLNLYWPNWGLAGNAGICPVGVGMSGSKVVRYVSDPHGGANLSGHNLPAMSIDGNVMLLNIRAMRAVGVQLPDFGGFQLYDLTLSVETILKGLCVVIAPDLACFHASGGNQEQFDSAKDSDSGRMYLAERLLNTEIESLNGPLDLSDVSDLFRSNHRVDLVMESLRNARVGRPCRKLQIISRTRFERERFLLRCSGTVAAFRSMSNELLVEHVVVSGNAKPEAFDLGDDVKVIIRNDGPEKSQEPTDDRFELVKFAAENLDGEYLWFLDDDDWLFPNGAEFIALVLNVMPLMSTFFVDSMSFQEEFDDASTGIYPKTCTPQRRFDADRFLGCLSGHNWIPFCGVIMLRSRLSEIPDSVIRSVTYYEDLASIFHLTSYNDFFPVVVDVLGAGISIHGIDQTVIGMKRDKWNRSMANLTSAVSGGLVSSSRLSMPTLAINHRGSDLSRLEKDLFQARASHADAIRYIETMRSSLTWRMTRPLRVIARLLARLVGDDGRRKREVDPALSKKGASESNSSMKW